MRERVVRTSRARSTGTTVDVIDNRDGSFEVGGQAWITLCADHGNYCEHATRKLAESFAAAPEEWCATCSGGSNQAGPHAEVV